MGQSSARDGMQNLLARDWCTSPWGCGQRVEMRANVGYWQRDTHVEIVLMIRSAGLSRLDVFNGRVGAAVHYLCRAHTHNLVGPGEHEGLSREGGDADEECRDADDRRRVKEQE